MSADKNKGEILMYKKYYILSLLVLANLTASHVSGMSTVARLLIIGGATGTTFCTTYVGAKASHANFNVDKTIEAIKKDRKIFVEKEMEFYKSAGQHIEKQYKKMQTTVKNWIDKKD